MGEYGDDTSVIFNYNQDFTVDVGIHLQWESKEMIQILDRGTYDFSHLDFDAQNMEKVWVPDIYFPNEKKASLHKILMDNKMLRLYMDGMLSYITRYIIIKMTYGVIMVGRKVLPLTAAVSSLLRHCSDRFASTYFPDFQQLTVSQK